MSVLLVLTVLAATGAGIAAWQFLRRYNVARGEQERVTALFSRYLSPPVVRELLARKDPRLFEAREYYATILCVRIRNFALLAEELPPEETLRYLNEFYTIVGQAVARHRGMIENLRGDTVSALFGVLIDERFQEERSLRAALDIMRMMNAMEDRYRAHGRKPLSIGIGVNSGKVVAGDIGNAQRRQFAVVGNAAHVATQLEAASEELNASIVASDVTYGPVRDLFVAVPTSSLPLRGLKRLHNAYIIRGLTRRSSADDRLTLPSEGAFKETIVRAPEQPAAVAEPDAYLSPDEPARVDTRVNAIAAMERSKFSSLDDDAFALPELPPMLGTYEDGDGPPYQLPP